MFYFFAFPLSFLEGFFTLLLLSFSSFVGPIGPRKALPLCGGLIERLTQGHFFLPLLPWSFVALGWLCHWWRTEPLAQGHPFLPLLPWSFVVGMALRLVED